MSDIHKLMLQVGSKARDAAKVLAVATTQSKNQALIAAADSLRMHKGDLLAANLKDMAVGEQKGLSPAMIDRLALDEGRIEAMAAGLDAIAELPDPVGELIAEWHRPNGLSISRVKVPIGVIGVIYESRPNVTADAGSLCLKAGNAAILRGGSESFHSSGAIMTSLSHGLEAAGLPDASIQLVPTSDRAAVGEMLKMTDYIDVIVPRGGKSLIERITAESHIPMFKHLEGICHIYVDATCDPEMARDVVVNAKMRRTGVCGAAETLLIERGAVASHLASIIDGLVKAGCEVRGEPEITAMDDRVIAASDQDWDTEYLEAIISLKVVDGIDGAIEHISNHSSQHTEAILSNDARAIETFLNRVDSAIVMANASTQYADGGEFGMGAEIGISTGKLHARGPVGVEQLTSFKYIVRGNGQCRP